MLLLLLSGETSTALACLFICKSNGDQPRCASVSSHAMICYTSNVAAAAVYQNQQPHVTTSTATYIMHASSISIANYLLNAIMHDGNENDSYISSSRTRFICVYRYRYRQRSTLLFILVVVDTESLMRASRFYYDTSLHLVELYNDPIYIDNESSNTKKQ